LHQATAVRGRNVSESGPRSLSSRIARKDDEQSRSLPSGKFALLAGENGYPELTMERTGAEKDRAGI